MRPRKEAQDLGYREVLYLDAKENKYIEELGAANIFAVYEEKNTLKTPQLTGSILPGITRDSILTIAKNTLNMTVIEDQIKPEDLFKADECFCSGTAAVISSIGTIHYDNKAYEIGDKHSIGPITKELYTELTNIQFGINPDPYGWTTTIMNI